MGVTADEIADVYARVKKHGRMGVDHAAWMKGAKFLRSLTPHEVTDFQQMCLTTDVETRRAAFRETSEAGGRKRCVPEAGGRKRCVASGREVAPMIAQLQRGMSLAAHAGPMPRKDRRQESTSPKLSSPPRTPS